GYGCGYRVVRLDGGGDATEAPAVRVAPHDQRFDAAHRAVLVVRHGLARERAYRHDGGRVDAFR
ncbi:hypothetical protein, partial [Salmonella enterica]|uniref:hypothetical protein n=1 Tax=Salmonella enterica TaxID=28901 RepID=UPI0021B432EB